MNRRTGEPSIANRVGGVAPARDQVAAPQVSITLGEQGDVLEALKDLFGGDPGFAISNEPLPDSALELAALYACILVDDDGNEVGAVLADIRATANLGGKLAGLRLRTREGARFRNGWAVTCDEQRRRVTCPATGYMTSFQPT